MPVPDLRYASTGLTLCQYRTYAMHTLCQYRTKNKSACDALSVLDTDLHRITCILRSRKRLRSVPPGSTIHTRQYWRSYANMRRCIADAPLSGHCVGSDLHTLCQYRTSPSERVA
eukprot:3690831-Rhodomonas_salina.7